MIAWLHFSYRSEECLIARAYKILSLILFGTENDILMYPTAFMHADFMIEMLLKLIGRGYKKLYQRNEGI